MLLLFWLIGFGVVHPLTFLLFVDLLETLLPLLYTLLGDGILLLPLFLIGIAYWGSPPSETPDYFEILIESCWILNLAVGSLSLLFTEYFEIIFELLVL